MKELKEEISNTLITIIIVNWNGLMWLQDCFASLYKQDYKYFEIIFVDNASKDGSVQWVKKYYPKTKIIINKDNLGFADANNIGYRKAKGEYILFLNNDTRVTKTFLTELVNVLEDDKAIGGAQSKILLMDKPDTHDSVGAFLTPTGFLYHYGFGKKDQPKYNKQIDLYTAKGACMMFRKDVLEKVAIDGNIFDPDYFAYFEETDMCHRVWLAGYRIVYAYKSVIFHKMGATSSGMNNAFIQYHSFKNRIRSYLKNFGTQWLWIYFPVHLLFCGFYSIVSILSGKWALGWAIQRAFWWNVRNMRETVRLRAYVQSHIRKIHDRELPSDIFKKPGLRYYWYLSRGIAVE
jgi:GT2 family glycosyltransferase